MTVIAYRDGVMASDSGGWIGSAAHCWTRKLVRANDGTLYGYAGDAAEVASHIAWVRGGRTGEEPKPTREADHGNSFVALIASPQGVLQMLCAGGHEQFEGAPYMAIGAEADVALGAMWMGANAVSAIMAAAAHGDRARLPVQCVSHAIAGDPVRLEMGS